MTGTVWDAAGAAPGDAELRETIRRKVVSAGTSFYWAMRLLPKDRRDGMYAISRLAKEHDSCSH